MGLCSCYYWATACSRKWVEFYVPLFQASNSSLIPSERRSIHLFPSPEQFWLFAGGGDEHFTCFKNFHGLEPSEYQKCCSLDGSSLGKAMRCMHLERSARRVMGRSWCLFRYPLTLVEKQLCHGEEVFQEMFELFWLKFENSAVRVYSQF